MSGLGPPLALFAVAVLAGACTTATSSSQVTSMFPESCAARAEPTALKIAPGSGITPPKSLRRVEPIAPNGLAGREVLATIEAVIGEDGKPRHICFGNGDPEWGPAVATAFEGWLFEPATLDGRPVAVLFTLTSRLRR